MKKAGFKAALTAVALVFSGLALAQGMPAPSPAPATASPPGYDSRPEPGQKPAMHQGERKHMKDGHHRKHMKDKHHMRPRHEGDDATQAMHQAARSGGHELLQHARTLFNLSTPDDNG